MLAGSESGTLRVSGDTWLSPVGVSKPTSTGEVGCSLATSSGCDANKPNCSLAGLRRLDFAIGLLVWVKTGGAVKPVRCPRNRSNWQR